MRHVITGPVLWLVAVLVTNASSGLTPGTTERESGARPSGTSKLDEKLLEGLGATPADRPAARAPAAADQSADERLRPHGRTLNPFAPSGGDRSENPLVRISEQMIDVQQKLLGRETSQGTQTTQRQILDELDELIDALSAQQQSQNQQQAASKAEQGDQGTRKTGKSAARDGSEQTADDTRSAEEATATFEKMFEEVWGHLPQRYRRQMQNAGSVEFLPQYRKLIEDYYKRLAEDRGG